MKKIMLLIALALLVPAAAWPSVIVSFEPSSLLKNVGDTFFVDIVADIADDQPVLSWGLDASFDDSILALIGFPVIGPLWDAGLDPDPPVGGVIDGFTGFAFPDPITGDIVLATLTFQAIAPGVSTLTAGYNDPLFEGFWPPLPPLNGDLNGDPSAGPYPDVHFFAGSVTVREAAIPEPASLFLLGTGLAGAWMFGRKGLRKH